MKHKRLTALVLAAALWLTGCGGAAAPAAPAGSGAASQSAADTAVQTAQKDRITEQFTLEKTIRNEYDITYRLNIHVPQLVCYSPDAAYLNYELAAMYAAEFRQYEDSPEIEPQQDEVNVFYFCSVNKKTHNSSPFCYVNLIDPVPKVICDL